jgi:hypothetical protein
MKAFTDRVNATLPIDEPDGVLFAMVASQRDTVCGKPCPTGQGLSEDGRCLPNAILAKATKKGAQPATVAQLPKVNPPLAENPAPAITGWSTTITAIPRPPSPAVAAAPVPPPAIVLAPAVASPPTEGRMALAGPPTEATPPGASLPYSALPPAAALAPGPRPQAAPAPPKRVVEGGASWTRTMNARRFESPN